MLDFLTQCIPTDLCYASYHQCYLRAVQVVRDKLPGCLGGLVSNKLVVSTVATVTNYKSSCNIESAYN